MPSRRWNEALDSGRRGLGGRGGCGGRPDVELPRKARGGRSGRGGLRREDAAARPDAGAARQRCAGPHRALPADDRQARCGHPLPISDAEAVEWVEALKAVRTGFLRFGSYGRASALDGHRPGAPAVRGRAGPDGLGRDARPGRTTCSRSGLADGNLDVRVTALMEVSKLWSWVPGRTIDPDPRRTALADWKEGFHGPVVRRLGDREPKARAAAVACLGICPIDAIAAPGARLPRRPRRRPRSASRSSSRSPAGPDLLTEDTILKHLYDQDAGDPRDGRAGPQDPRAEPGADQPGQHDLPPQARDPGVGDPAAQATGPTSTRSSGCSSSRTTPTRSVRIGAVEALATRDFARGRPAARRDGRDRQVARRPAPPPSKHLPPTSRRPPPCPPCPARRASPRRRTETRFRLRRNQVRRRSAASPSQGETAAADLSRAAAQCPKTGSFAAVAAAGVRGAFLVGGQVARAEQEEEGAEGQHRDDRRASRPSGSSAIRDRPSAPIDAKSWPDRGLGDGRACRRRRRHHADQERRADVAEEVDQEDADRVARRPAVRGDDVRRHRVARAEHRGHQDHADEEQAERGVPVGVQEREHPAGRSPRRPRRTARAGRPAG